MSEIRILNLCHKNTILVDIFRQSLLITLYYNFPHGKVPYFLTAFLSAISQDDAELNVPTHHTLRRKP